MWDQYYDPHEYCLAGESYTEKIYWPREMGTIFIPFQYTTKHSTLCDVYKKKQDEWNTRMPKGPTLSISTDTTPLAASVGSTEETNIINMME